MKSLFKFLSSLKLAVVTLISLAAVLAVGTGYESLYDAETARHYIYGTPWFAALLCLLATNVFCSALSRWPWKRHHTGFLVTHLGILILLGGSLLTLLKGYEGQMILAEGETGKKMTLKEAELFFYDSELGKLEQKPAEFRFEPPSKDKPWTSKVLEDVQATVDEFIPHAVDDIEVKPDGPFDNPALQVKLSGSRATMQEWVFAREFDRQSLNLGPAAITYVDLPNPEFFAKLLQDPKAYAGPLLRVAGQVIPVRSNLNQTISVGDRRVTLLEYYPHAAVDQGELRNLDEDRQNPALNVAIRSPRGEERHTAFAKFPMLPTVHGEVEHPTPLRLYDLPDAWNASDNALLLARMDDERLYYAAKSAGRWGRVQKYSGGEPIATGWMDFQFTVARDEPKARIEKVYHKVPVPKGQEGPPSALHLSLANAIESQGFWIGRGENRDINLGGRKLKVAYGLKSLPIGFELKLNDFRMKTYEGTKDPSSYESQVTLVDHQLQQDHLIQMNRPMKYGRYKFFQASYQLNPSGPDWSVLAVTYDPGIPFKYTGALVMVTGIILMFFFKPLFVQKRVREKTRPIEATEGFPAAAMAVPAITSTRRMPL